MYRKNITTNQGNRKHRKSIKIKLRYDLLWNIFVQTLAQTRPRSLNMQHCPSLYHDQKHDQKETLMKLRLICRLLMTPSL